MAGKGRDALITVETLRKLPAPASEDPRIDLAEGAAAGTLGDFKRQQGASEQAATKSTEAGQRLLAARARLSEGHALYWLSEFDKSIAVSQEAQKIYSTLRTTT